MYGNSYYRREVRDWLVTKDFSEVCGLAGVDERYIKELLTTILDADRETAKAIGKPARRILANNHSYHF